MTRPRPAGATTYQSTHPEGPLVRIDPARLRAAIRYRGLSIKETAFRCDSDHRTVDAIFRSQYPHRRTRRARRHALALILGCPERWLAGQPCGVPCPPWAI